MKKLIILIFIFVNFFIIYLSYPFFYTNDGASYLSSAKSLFTNDQYSAYEWLREPGYPILLKIINLILGNSGNLVIFIQAIFLISSILIIALLVENTIQPKFKNLFWLLLIFLSLLGQLYFQYSSMVLQQSLFTFFLALYALVYQKANNVFLQLLFTVFIILITVNTSILFYYFNIIFIITLFIKILLKNYKVREFKKIVLIFLTFVIFLGINNFANFAWNNYKKQAIQKIELLSKNPLEVNRESVEEEIETAVTDQQNSVPIKTQLNRPSINRATFDRLLSENSRKALTELIYSGKENSENYYFLTTLLDEVFNCGGNVATGAEYFRNYSQFYFEYACKNNFIRKHIHENLIDLYYYFYSFIMIVFFIFGVYRMIKQVEFRIFFIPFVFYILYVINILNYDRYLIPLYPFALSLVTYELVKLISRIRFYK